MQISTTKNRIMHLSRFSKTVTAFTSDDIQTVPGSTGAKETRADRDRACLILRCFKSKDGFRAFMTYVSRYWSPRYVYLKDKLVSVQHRFTKRLKGFGHISYAARLDRLKAETL